MKYKFIGTEQDLIDNGYKMSVFDNRIYYKNIDFTEITINIKTNRIIIKWATKNIFKELDRLVEKGLVVEE